jgi:hypothetical protein
MEVQLSHFFVTISLNVVFSFHFLFIFALEYRLQNQPGSTPQSCRVFYSPNSSDILISPLTFWLTSAVSFGFPYTRDSKVSMEYKLPFSKLFRIALAMVFSKMVAFGFCHTSFSSSKSIDSMAWIVSLISAN